MKTKSGSRKLNLFARSIIVMVVLFISLSIDALKPITAQEAPSQQSQSELCSLFPAGFTDFKPGFSYSLWTGGPAPKDSCMAEWTIDDKLDYSTQLTISAWNDVNSAQQAIENLPFLHNASDEAQWHPTSAFGDAAFEQLTPRGAYVFAFRRGCYTAVTETVATLARENIDPRPVQNLAIQIDQRLKDQPPCPGGQPAAAKGTLGSAIACDTNRLRSDGMAVFTASPENQQPDATLVYEWSVDGQAQTAVTGNNLVLNDVTPGKHQVTVVVKDTTNGLTAPPQSCNFTWDPNGTSSGSDGDSLGPVVVGGAIASGIALVLLSIVVASVRRSRRANLPVPPLSGPINARPTTLPESPRITVIPDPSVDPPQLPRPTSLPEPVGGLAGTSLPTPVSPAVFTTNTQNPISLPDPMAGFLSAIGPTLGSPAANMTDTMPPLDEAQQSPDDQNKSDSKIRVYLEISPSVQTERRNFADPHVWGDGVDLVVAGFRLEITPGWRVDGSQAQPVTYDYQVQSRWWPANQVPYNPGDGPDVPGYYLYGADKLAAQFASQKTLWGPAGDPTAAMVISQPLWSQRPGSLQFHVKVTAALVNGKGETATATDEDTQTIPVIGANPHLEYDTDSDIGYSDGSYSVEITPRLWMFGEIYLGGQWVVEKLYPGALGALTRGDFNPKVKILATGEEDQYHHPRLFEATPQQFTITVPGLTTPDGQPYRQIDPKAEKLQQSVSLRCKFLLDQDPLIKKIGDQGVSISFPVYVTGDGVGGAETDFDWMPAQHYKACKKHWINLTPEQITPAKLKLVPSTIQCASPDPKRLPHGKDRNHFTSTLSAVLYSGRGVPITGKESVGWVKSDLIPGMIQQWGFLFYYDPPEDKWRREAPYSDQGLSEGAGLFIACSAASQDFIPVDEETGTILFEGKPQLTYDHQKYFYRAIDDTGKNKYLFAQTCDLRAKFVAKVQVNTRVGPSKYTMEYSVPEPIHIDKVNDQYYRLTVWVKAQSGEGLNPAQLTITPASGGTPVTGETDQQGKVVINVPVLKNPYKASVLYRTDAEDNRRFGWWKGGRPVELKGELEFQSDEEFTIPVPVSTIWALETSLSAGISTPTPLVQGGTLYVSAFLIDRSIMKEGDVDSDSLRNTFLGSPDPRKWRRILLASVGVTVGWSPPIPISFDYSFPGAADFRTKNPVCWADFACPGQIRQGSIDLGGGKSSENAKFDSVVLSKPADGWIDVSSNQMGVSGAGVQHVAGTWSILD